MISQQTFFDNEQDNEEKNQNVNSIQTFDFDVAQNSSHNQYVSNKFQNTQFGFRLGVSEYENSHEQESQRTSFLELPSNTAKFDNSLNKQQNDESNITFQHQNNNFQPQISQFSNAILGKKPQQRKDNLQLNEISLNYDGADKRRQLFNYIDSDLENIRTKRQSIMDLSNSIDETKKLKLEQSIESLYKIQQEDNYVKNRGGSSQNTPFHNSNQGMTLSKSLFLHNEKNQNKLKSKITLEDKSTQNLQPSIDMIRQFSQEGSRIIQGDVAKISLHKKQNQQLLENTPSAISVRGASPRLSMLDKEENIPMKPITLIYVRRFINSMKRSVYSSQFKNLKINQIKLINDLSHNQDSQMNSLQQNKKKFSLIQSYKDRLSKMKGICIIYDKYLKNIIISSQSNFYMLYQVLLLISILIEIYMIPLRICFDISSGQQSYKPFSIITIITLPIFFTEIVLNCITSYYQDGLEVRKQKKIIKKYIKDQFLGDVVTFCTLIISLYSSQVWISVIFLIRISRIPKLINSIDDHFQLEHRFPSSYELLKLLLLIATIGHYCGCGFNYLGQYELKHHEYSWLEFKKIQYKDWSVQYLSGLYFSFITMITVGYGDITPQTSKEIMYVLFMTFISCGTFGYSINTIGSIFREMQVRKSELKRQKYEVTYYMINRNIPKNIQIKVIKELEHFQLRQQQNGQKGDLILQQLSLNIRNEVKKEYFGKLLQKYKLLKLNFSDQFIEQLSLKLKEVFLSPDEVILKQGELLNKVFCVVSGELIVFQDKITNPSDHIIIGKIKKDQFSDQRAIFYEHNIEYGLKSAGISQLVYFTNEDFVNTLKAFPQEYEKFSMLKDNMIYQKKFIDLKCYCCGQYGHQTNLCSMVHYIADHELIAKKENDPRQSQQRFPNHKRQEKKIKALKMKQQLGYILKDFRLKQIQKIFPSYEYTKHFNQSDESFFTQVPEIYLDGEELFVNIDDFVDEEEDYYTHNPSEYDKQQTPRNKSQSHVHEQQSPMSIPNQNFSAATIQLQKQDSNINQHQQHINSRPSISFHGEKEKSQSVIDWSDQPTPQSQNRKKNERNRSQSEVQQNQQKPQSPKNNQGGFIQGTFSNLTNMQLNTSNQNTNQSHSQSGQALIINTQMNQQQYNNQPNSPYTPNLLGEEPSSTLPNKFQYIQSNQDTNYNQVNGSLISRPNIANNNNNNNIQNINEQTHSSKGRRSIGFNVYPIVTSVPIQQNPYANNILSSPKIMQAVNNIANHFQSSNLMQQNSQYDIQNQKLTNQMTSASTGQQSNEFHAQQSFIHKQQNQNYLSSEQSYTSIGECISPIKPRNEKKKSTLNTKKTAFKINASLYEQILKTANTHHPSQFAGQSVSNQLYHAATLLSTQQQRTHTHSTQNHHQNSQIQQQMGQQNGHHYNPYNITVNQNALENLICDFPYGKFDLIKNFKFYFTHGNIENIQKSYNKYMINTIESRKYFKSTFKRKIIKQFQQQVMDLINEQSGKSGRQGAFDLIGGNSVAHLKKNSQFYKRKVYQQSKKKITECYENTKQISMLIEQ